MKHIKLFNEHNNYSHEDFTMSDLEDVKELLEDGLYNPSQISIETGLDIETVVQIIDTLKK